MAEKCLGNRQSGHGNGITAVHHPDKAGIGWDHAFAGYVMPAAGKADAEILVQGGGDELGKVEAGEGEAGHGF